MAAWWSPSCSIRRIPKPDKLAAGETTGAVYEWQPHKGFTLIPGSQMSGNNGIEKSRHATAEVDLCRERGATGLVVRLCSRGWGVPAGLICRCGFLADNLR